MRLHSIVLLVLLSFLTYSCSDDSTAIGIGIQPTSDQITVGTDTVHVSTATVPVNYLIANQDSFLLGTFYDLTYGSIQAEILAQVTPPADFRFPPRSVPDSAVVILRYASWFGDNYSPMEINIYEMNKSTFNYTGVYQSNLDPTIYTDQSIRLGNRIITATDALGKRTDSITFRLPDNFVRRFFPDTTKAYYTSNTDFTNNIFKGLYIKANYGAATMLNVSQIDLLYYYHYTVPINNRDTVINNSLSFPANAEVRQVNRFLYPDRNTVTNPGEDINYISSPANFHTRVEIPLGRMKEKMDSTIGNKKLSMNSAILRVEATNVNKGSLPQPLINYILLVKESYMDEFFTKKQMPSDTVAVLGQIATSKNASTGETEYYYNFNVATLIANEIRIAGQKRTAVPEKITMRLVPVQATFVATSQTTQTLTEIKQRFSMGAVTVRSGKNPVSPMKINMVYSGF